MSLPKDTVPDPHADPLVASAMRAAEAIEAPGCPDAELLGLYADRDLDRDATSRLEAHLHDCARCQAIVAAYVRALPEESGGGATAGVSGGFAAWLAGWRWLVPAASLTAAAVVAVWIGRGPADEVAELARTSAEQDAGSLAFARPDAFVEGQPRSRALPPGDAPSSPPAAAPGVVGRTAEAPGTTRAKAEATAEQMAGARPEVADRVAERKAREDAPANAAKSASAATAENRAAPPQEAATAMLWRARDGRIERTRDNGATWQPISTPAGIAIIAVASPSPDVCWAIGDDVVLKTTDGTTWVRTTRPSTERLAGVGATSATEASVVTATGAIFGTSDGGRSWARAR